MNFCYLLLTILFVKKVASYPEKVNCDLTSQNVPANNIQTATSVMNLVPTAGTYVTLLTGNSAVTGATVALMVAGASSRGILHATGGTLSCAGGTAATGCTGTMSMCFYNSIPSSVSWTAPAEAGDYVIFFATSSGMGSSFGRQSITVTVTGAGGVTAAPTATAPTATAPTAVGTTGAPTGAVGGLTCSVGTELYTSAGAMDTNVEYTDVAATGILDTCMEITTTVTDATTTFTSCVRMIQMNAACVPSTEAIGGSSVVTTCCQTNNCNKECVASAPKSNSAVSLVPYSAIVIAAIFKVFA